ncbi:filamentous hemagglutinin N-terminal domain-containing protein [Tolypothrix sp. FACHB-123]|uniref:two-partner secretion domain-containing protein n=1 Tax=Tolypothrix sp. FACHB-123 TaxID=2692868 RepID=UPI001683CF30|nr:filamentous hemagglutinin N-terminal domain-containing protein [Tolypothrix sp. FACHB-123]MBD2354973.1 filamentous hemagglutinin N-terminal domain-containing protein [Tolypothrix sp. FACHB-123]
MNLPSILTIAGLFATTHLIYTQPSYPQAIAPDGSLPTSVTSDDGVNFSITGGTQAGGNLFHSFSQFSVPNGGSANFSHASVIQNIISRVTGLLPSYINGKIHTLGSANLFLINPNGIIFGPNAQLNIGGSFFATTANSLQFADGKEFHTSLDKTTPLLSINVPIGLQFTRKSKPIQVQTANLTVPINQTLALIGGDVNINNAQLTAASGHIELGGIADAGTVGISLIRSQSQFNFPANFARANISITDNSLVTTSGDGGGSIQLTGKQLTIENSWIKAETLGDISGANLRLNASDSIIVSSNRKTGLFADGLFATNSGSGDSLGITINTSNLQVKGESRISTAALPGSAGKGGDLTINTKEAIELSGVDSEQFFLFTGLLTDTYGTGAGGNLTLNTKRLWVHHGAQISAATFSDASGGTLTINATKSVELIGVTASDSLSSGLFTAVQEGNGQGGDLIINTKNLIINDGAQIFAGTTADGNSGNIIINAIDSVNVKGISPIYRIPGGVFSGTNPDTTGDAGNITINTRQLTVEAGGNIAVETLGFGQGGVLTINATDSIQLLGQGPLRENPLDTSRLIPTFSSLSASVLDQQNNNQAGNLEIFTNKLLVREGARLSVDNEGLGKGGNINIQANSIVLDNRGNPQPDSGGIQATTKSGEGGNITLLIQDILLMRNGSKITTDATGGKGNGGDIHLNSRLLVGAENSDITANAIAGQGGNVQITTQGIFGIEFRPKLTVNSDITASSQFGLNGTVEIKTLAVDPSKGITFLAVQPNDASTLITQGCRQNNPETSSRLTVIGRGGLPPQPEVALVGDTTLQDIQTVPIQTSSDRTLESNTSASIPMPKSDEIIEAQGLVFTPQGELVLTVQAPANSLHRSGFTPVTCHSN